MPNTVYENKVIENKMAEMLTTRIDLNNYLTPDYSLTEAPGMIKEIHVYKATGNVEDLAQGVGNSGTIVTGYVSRQYVVGVTQGKGQYFDEEAMKDPFAVDTLVRGMADAITNDFTQKAITEFGKATLSVECDFSTGTSGYLFGKIVDALALFGENVNNLFLLINPKNVAYARKQLGDSLQYSEGFVRTGYIGTIAGVPVIVSNAVPESAAYIAHREAVTAFIKKGVEVEQDRDPDVRRNDLYIRKVAVIALTDASKVVAVAKAQSTACAITTYTKNAKTIAGTCGTNCYLVHVVDGDGLEYDVTPTSGSWTMTAAENLTAGDKINATAYAIGYAAKAATEVTVAS